MAEAFREIKTYSQFDIDCSTRLTTLSNVLYKLGQYRMRMALHEWYVNALKPYHQLGLNESLAFKIFGTRSRVAVLNVLKQFQQQRLTVYSSKTNGINLVWERLVMNYKSELKRALAIWAEANRKHKAKYFHFKMFLVRLYKKKMLRAMLLWKTHDMELDAACRLIMLRREHVQKIFLTSVFQAFKQEVYQMRKLRILHLGRIWKAWQDYVMSRRHGLLYNLSIMKFTQVNQTYHIKVCFDALKYNKAKRAAKLMETALRQDMDVALQQHEETNKKIAKKMHTASLDRACQAFRNMLGGRVYSYFRQWKESTKYQKNTISSKFRDKVYSIYRNKMLNAFMTWKGCATKKKKKKMKKMMQSLESQGGAVEKEAIVEQQKEKAEAVAVRAVATKKKSKCFRKLILRILKAALYRWKERVNTLGYTKERNEACIIKMRNRLTREAFERYK